jgi:hypothetical protein
MWTWVNQKSSSLFTRGKWTTLLSPADTANSASMLVKSLPAGPYSAIFQMEFFLPDADYATAGVLIRESVSGKFKGLYHDYESSPVQPPSQQLGVGFGLDGLNKFTGSYKTLAFRDFVDFFKIQNDGVSESFSVSFNGLDWIELFQHPVGTDLVADQVGFFVNSRNTQGLATMVACKLKLN